MIGLSHFLPPLAADYSGAASLFYEHGIMTVVFDAGCCTKNYLDCEEVRWIKRQKPVFSVSLRTMDVVMGNEQALIQKILRTVEGFNGSIPAIALVGTPVPAIAGTDMEGIACEIEDQTGIPTMGLNTSGFKSYDSGLFAAFKLLLKKFGTKGRSCQGEGSCILGASIFDYGTSGYLADGLRSNAAGTLYPNALEEHEGLGVFELLGQSKLNYAASSVGVQMAKHLQRLYGTPFEIGLPNELAPLDVPDVDRVLIVHDQVVANSMRQTMSAGEIRVASFCGWDAALACPGDMKTPDESTLISLIREFKPELVIGDPLLANLLKGMRSEAVLAPLPFPALSARLTWL